MLRRTGAQFVHVSVVGASGGIGQPLALLCKANAKVTKLTLFDLAHTPGVAADLSHISTPADVSGFAGDDLAKCLQGAEIVVVPAGVPRKPGMTRDDLFNMNASVVAKVMETAAQVCPKAMICIITNPVNSTVPIAAEVLKKAGVYDPKRLFGVTSLDLVRASTFVRQLKGGNFVDVPVVGGHSGPTIVPLLSRVPGVKFTDEETATLTKRIQYAGDEVVNAKAGAGSATLSMAYAGYRFVNALIEARSKPTKEWAFIQTDVEPAVPFFATNVTLGPDGVVSAEKVGKLSAFEQEKYADCVKQLTADISKGQSWATAK